MSFIQLSSLMSYDIKYNNLLIDLLKVKLKVNLGF